MVSSRLDAARAQWRAPSAVHPTPAALRCRAKFLRCFPRGFADETYLDRERGNPWTGHERWNELLGPTPFRELLDAGDFTEIAARAVTIESPTKLLRSYERTALREAISAPDPARTFATGLYDFLQGNPDEQRFDRWARAVAKLPRKRTRVLRWPVLTVFGFIARPDTQIFQRPDVTRIGARQYGFDLRNAPQPAWDTYASLLEFAALIRRDLSDLSPRDMIDVQSFIRVQGSDEYEE